MKYILLLFSVGEIIVACLTADKLAGAIHNATWAIFLCGAAILDELEKSRDKKS